LLVVISPSKVGISFSRDGHGIQKLAATYVLTFSDEAIIDATN
jgi:hypothetical protein